MNSNNNITIRQIQTMAMSLTNDISDIISDSIEALDIFDETFRKDLNSVFYNVLKDILFKNEDTSLYYEIIPGFTLIALRKNKDLSNTFKFSKDDLFSVDNFNKKTQLLSNEAEKALLILAQKFSTKTNNKVIMFENNNILLFFLPVNNLHENLRVNPSQVRL